MRTHRGFVFPLEAWNKIFCYNRAHTEASHSGLVRTLGKRVRGNPPRVRISPPPPRLFVIGRPEYLKFPGSVASRIHTVRCRVQVMSSEIGSPDSVLKEQKGYDTAGTVFSDRQKALALLEIIEDDVVFLGAVFEKIYRKNKSSRNAQSMINGAIFAVTSRNNGNPEWREHCAGSLRELLDECSDPGKMSTWFCDTFNNHGGRTAGFPSYTSNPDAYKKLGKFYDYFSEIHHHSAREILERLQDIYGRENIKTGSDSEETFTRAAKDYIKELLTMFRGRVSDV